MSVFDACDYDDHEQVVYCRDPESGLFGLIAIHNTARGPALGGCRMWPYASEEEGLRDALRLSRGMTYKSAMANLALGGGKSVIFGDPRKDKSEALMRAMGRHVERLGGRYIAAEDAGTSVPDLQAMAKETAHVAGIAERATADGIRSGDPSPATAYGVYIGIRASVKHRLGVDDLSGLRIAVQGVGSVGLRVARHLQQSGATLLVSDIYPQAAAQAVNELGATAVDAQSIHSLDVDVFAPCALGAVINDETVSQIRASVIAGSANNQLERDEHGRRLAERDILYAPDYVINAGGIIDVACERDGSDRDRLVSRIEAIGTTLTEIFQRADVHGEPTNTIADRIAEERFQNTSVLEEARVASF